MSEEVKVKGGKREGAGRPKLPDEGKARPITIKLPPHILTWLNQQPKGGRTKLIVAAIEEVYGVGKEEE